MSTSYCYYRRWVMMQCMAAMFIKEKGSKCSYNVKQSNYKGCCNQPCLPPPMKRWQVPCVHVDHISCDDCIISMCKLEAWVRTTLGKACGFPKHLAVFRIWIRYLVTKASLPNVNGAGQPLCFVLIYYICNSLLSKSAMEAHAHWRHMLRASLRKHHIWVDLRH